MSNKLTSTVWIFGQPYKVKFCKMSKDAFGFCHFDKKLIEIDKDSDDKTFSLLHEILHAVLFESGLKYMMEDRDGFEEAIVRAIEHGLKSTGLIKELNLEQDNER